ncbi:sec-independent protein translocase protein TatA [Psychromicrobium silvestre]|uniref:Sec-independent protein translocase protein TatA n=1 Tax=Psychromicrobium silvestre TaxID=1645614 RepID=A0A7Y9LRJ1_9MICC|nr:sec-independent protein translocase protein TatA [Psychromicrobium silvestre]
MGRLFENPVVIIVIVVVIVLLIAAPKLPAMARSLGQSFRIIKSEVRESKNDGQDAAGTAQSTGTPAEGPVEGTIVTPVNPQANNGNNSGTSTPPGNTTV